MVVLATAAQTVSAAAASVTALTAIVAATFAFAQVRQAARTRREQAQPYVAVFVELNPSNPNFFDLVIKNFGKTAARNVQISVTPPLERSNGEGGVQKVEVADRIRTLVPDQEWRTWWDSMVAREDLSLPKHHIARVSYEDDAGRRQFAYDYDLDLSVHEGKLWVKTYGLNEGMRALSEIEKHIRKSREGLSGGFKVFVRDGDARDERRRESHNARLDRLQRDKLWDEGEPPNPDEDG